MDTSAVKVVVTGPFAAGKTTFIATLSEIPVVATEKAVTDDTRQTKELTTVAMDFGRITIGQGDTAVPIYLFGTPGQDRFRFMWDVLSIGMLGFVVVVDVTREDSVRDAGPIIEYFRRLSGLPFVVAANRGITSPSALGGLVPRLGIPEDRLIVPCEAPDRESAKQVLLALLGEVLRAVDAEPAAS